MGAPADTAIDHSNFPSSVFFSTSGGKNRRWAKGAESVPCSSNSPKSGSPGNWNLRTAAHPLLSVCRQAKGHVDVAEAGHSKEEEKRGHGMKERALSPLGIYESFAYEPLGT